MSEATSAEQFGDHDEPEIRKNQAGILWSPDWLGENRHLYRPKLWRSADNIEVARLRQIFIWPLVLRMRELRPFVDGRSTVDLQMERTAEAIREATNDSGPIWSEIEDLLDHAPAPATTRFSAAGLSPDYERKADAVHRYGEFVYFYDFLQALLFSRQPEGDATRPVRIFSRKDVTCVEATLFSRSGDITYKAAVDRCNLHLFGTGAAALVLEVDFGPQPTVVAAGESRAMTLADAQRFIDVARRSYTPAFDLNESAATWPLYTPKSFKWMNGICPIVAVEELGFCETWKLVKKTNADGVRTATISEHWRALVRPLVIAGSPDDEKLSTQPVWRHVVDDRIPIMSYVSLSDAAGRQGLSKTREQIAALDLRRQAAPDQRDVDRLEREIADARAEAARADLWLVTRGDWLRLCYADSPGTDPMPYAPSFFENFEEVACYDRYFPCEATTSSLRYLFAGYHFCVVGAGDYFDHTVVHHFRRHYMQMGLVLNMELALLLATSSRMSTAVNRFKQSENSGKSDARVLFRREFLTIKEDFLQFVHLYRFTDLSNQIQASEMFKKWRCAMGLDQVFTDVKTELDTAAEFLIAEAQDERATAATRLTLIAAVVAILALAFSFLGMNVLVDKDVLNPVLSGSEEGWRTLARHSAVVGGVVAIFGGLAYWVHELFQEGNRSGNVTFGQFCKWIVFAGGLVLIVGVILGWNPTPR